MERDIYQSDMNDILDSGELVPLLDSPKFNMKKASVSKNHPELSFINNQFEQTMVQNVMNTIVNPMLVMVSLVDTIICALIPARERKSGELGHVTYDMVVEIVEKFEEAHKSISFSTIQHINPQQNNHRVCCGIIGCGKSTFAHRLAQISNNAIYIPEEIDKSFSFGIENIHTDELGSSHTIISNPYLDDFYKRLPDNRIVMEMQWYLLLSRLAAHLIAILCSSNHKSIQDRSIFEDQIFVKMFTKSGTITKEEAAQYEQVFNRLEMTGIFSDQPVTFIFFNTMPSKALAQVQSRKRKCEEVIDLKYMELLDQEYREFMLSLIRKINPRYSNITVKMIYERTDMTQEEWLNLSNKKIPL